MGVTNKSTRFWLFRNLVMIHIEDCRVARQAPERVQSQDWSSRTRIMAFWRSEWRDLFFQAITPTQLNISEIFFAECLNWVISSKGLLRLALSIEWFMSYDSPKSGYTLLIFRKNLIFELEVFARPFRVLPVGLKISPIPFWKAWKLYFCRR